MLECKNPIMPGFYPDPSICRVGDFFYMVHSTFVYFPGIPVFRSRDLANWEQIGNALERPSQLLLTGCEHREGIYAPTIRYHDGMFYIIATNVPDGGNFIIRAEDPAGPYSDPFYLGKEAAGIDPSLFFDQDGSCYYIGQREKTGGGEYFGDCEIWIQPLDLETMRLTGQAMPVLRGFQKKAVWPEGPHLYKKDGFYYILHAESGTEQYHCVVVARSKNLFGPYEYDRANPILTHRHLGKRAKVTCVGHGDFVEDGQGNWYMMVLACRPQEGYTLLGRETFLAKVAWEDGWPVVNPGIGMLQETVRLPEILREDGKEKQPFMEEVLLDVKKNYGLMALRGSGEAFARSTREGLQLKMVPQTLREKTTPAYLCVRQRHHNYRAEAQLCLISAKPSDCAGLAVLQDNENHLRVECSVRDGKRMICVISCRKGKDTLLGRLEYAEKEPDLTLRMEIKGLLADVSVLQSGGTVVYKVVSDVDLRFLSTEEAGGFTGCTVGIYASGNGQNSDGRALFRRFSYSGGSRDGSGYCSRCSQ